MQCTAKSKRSQEQCRAHAIPHGNGKCHYHGGSSPRGIASSRFKTGRYSKYIPNRMAASYSAASGDKKILEMHEDVALIESRLTDLLSRVDTGEAGRLWRLASTLFSQLQRAYASGDGEAMAKVSEELDEALKRGRSDYHAWDEVGRALDQKRRTIDSENKRRVQEKQLVPIAELGLIVRALAGAVASYVTDVGVLRAVNDEWTRILVRDTGTGYQGTPGDQPDTSGPAPPTTLP